MDDKIGLSEIYILQDRLNSVEKNLHVYNETFHELVHQIQSLNNVISNSLLNNTQEHDALKNLVNNLQFELGDPRNIQSEFFYPKIIGIEKTIQEIVSKQKSIARFGDGEFSIIFGRHRHSFQRVDEELGKRLIQVLQCDVEKLMIGIADNYGNLETYTDYSADAIRNYMQVDIRREHLQLLSREKTYYNAYITRPYFMYRDKFTDEPKKRFEQLRRIWDQRNVIMVEGAQTRLGIGNDLFDNCKSIRRILAPAKNSYDRYSEVLESALANAKMEDLFLVATGPSAAVFVYDLVINGFQAVDVGHVDIEYEWLLKGTGEREPIQHKYTNEVVGQECAENIQDPVYESQIIDAFL